MAVVLTISVQAPNWFATLTLIFKSTYIYTCGVIPYSTASIALSDIIIFGLCSCVLIVHVAVDFPWNCSPSKHHRSKSHTKLIIAVLKISV